MPNPIKYTTGTETLALKKGNFYIATGDVGKGPSDTTGYYQGPNVPSGGYVIYLNKEGAPGGLSYHSAANDAQLIAFTNNLAGQSYTTVNECLVYYAGQNDKVVLNRDYEGIVTDGLVLNVDAGFTPSYPRSGTTWSDVSLSGNNGTLTNGPTFNSGDGGSIVFDGVDDYATGSLPNFNVGCISVWINPTTLVNSDSSFQSLIVLKYLGTNNSEWYISLGSATVLLVNEYITLADVQNGTRTSIADGGTLSANTWYNLVFNLESGTYKIYINNIKKTETTFGGGVQQLTAPNMLQLGALVRLDVISGPFQGNIASVQIYNRALTAAEVLQNYNAQKGRFGL